MENGTLEQHFQNFVIFPNIHKLIQSIFDEHALDDMIEDGHETIVNENPLNENFYKKISGIVEKDKS